MSGVARTLAIAGGLVLLALIALTCMSVIGRALNTLAHTPQFAELLPALSQFLIDNRVGPVPGDFELVESGIAFAIFAFLPWCQLGRGHATVDLFQFLFPAPANRAIDVVSELLITLITLLLAWRLAVGMMDKMSYGETTLLLQFPVWWSYAACLFAAAIGCLIAVYATVARTIEWWTGVPAAPSGSGAH